MSLKHCPWNFLGCGLLALDYNFSLNLAVPFTPNHASVLRLELYAN